MSAPWSALACAIALMCAAPSAPAQTGAAPSVDQQAWRAAAREAQHTYPLFLNAVRHADLSSDNPDPDIYMVRAALHAKDGAPEYIWVRATAPHWYGLEGYLADPPQHAASGHMGDRVVVRRHDVVDWLFTGGGDLMYGGYTIRVEMPTLSADDQNIYRQVLSPSPLPARWVH